MQLNKKEKIKKEFSKVLLIQESALIWIISLVVLYLAFYCIRYNYLGSLPWITAMISLPWTAYGVSQAFYYNKSKAENTKDGIKFETVVREIETTKISSAATEIKKATSKPDIWGPI